MKKEGSKLWGGRFKKPIAHEVLEFSESISFDHRLALFDLAQSRAHVRGLNQAGLLSRSELAKILAALDKTQKLVVTGKLPMPMEFEDIHTAIEKKVTELAGDAGKKLHTARSRNDQVATDLRLYIKAVTESILESGAALVETLAKLAAREAASLMPGYTHLQRAMPVTLGHHLAAYGFMLSRDLDRFASAVKRGDELPLGAGALAGSNHALPRARTAKALGFSGPTLNSLDSVSSRDLAFDFLAACAQSQIHLSRLCEDIILWASQEYGFVELDDAWATGSSLMPQKKNPDVAELVRGKSARTVGNLVSLSVLLKGLPLAYNRDLQEDKIFIFDSAATVDASFSVMTGFLNSLRFRRDKMAAAVDQDPAILATDLADILVKAGVPFRSTHEIVGGLVGKVLAQGRRLQDLSDAELQSASKAFPRGSSKRLTGKASIESKKAIGGPAPANVRAQAKTLLKLARKYK